MTLLNQANSTSNIHSSEFCAISYDIFGSPYQKTGSFLANDSLDFGYLGKPYNADTELYDYGFRDYSPEIARFTTVDPIRDGRNWYSYVVNDPVNYVDLWGLQCKSENDESKKLVLKMGGRKLTNSELFDYLVDVVEGTEIMGKSYSTDPENVYVCTTFVGEILDILNIDKNEYLPGGQLVIDTIEKLDDLKTATGTNPSAGTYIFYYDYGDGTGHTGFVNFDDKGNTKILHNGSDGNQNNNVNLRTRDDRDFETWFNSSSEGKLYYKKLEADIWEE